MSIRAAAFLLAGLILFAVVPASQAQTISGIVAGTVVDAKGKPLPSVSITAKNPLSGRVYPASTNSQGYFRILEVPPGFYEVQADLGGFQTTRHTGVYVSVNRTTVENFTLQIQVKEEVLTRPSKAPMTDKDSATLSTSFDAKQITEVPILTRDVNNLGLLAPGVLSVRTFSFASTLVPFSVNGSRGRDNNFIIDSVDNNEPLFGGAASQFTNTDIFAEYSILTNQLKAEFGRNSGATINAITKSGSNDLHGTLFWFGQNNAFDAESRVEKAALLSGPAPFAENQFGATLGGHIKKDRSFYFISYQWDRSNSDLSDVYPVLSNLPTSGGLASLKALNNVNPLALNSLLSLPSFNLIPGMSARCFRSPVPAGFNATNPCVPTSTPVTVAFNGFVPINADFNIFRVPNGNVFNSRDHQFSGRFDQRLNNSNDIYVRYLFDDLAAPRIPLAPAGETAFADVGVLPDWRLRNKQRSQSLLVNHRYYRVSSLNELRASYTRISQGIGAFQLPKSVQEKQAAATIVDTFDNTNAFATAFGRVFPSAGNFLTVGRDSNPTYVTSNTYQIQDNFSKSVGKQSIKFGGAFVRIESNIRSTPSDLGQYFFLPLISAPLGQFVGGLASFLNEPQQGQVSPITGIVETNSTGVSQRFANVISDASGNITGQGRDALMLREYDAFVFAQDDWRVRKDLTISAGVRYENFGQPINSIRKFNPAGPHVNKDNNNFAPRLGFAWSPWDRMVVRGGYSIFYNPTVLNIPLLIWQSGPISPLVTTDSFQFSIIQPSGTFPNQPLTLNDINQRVGGCSRFADLTNSPAILPSLSIPGTVPLIQCSDQEKVDPNLKNPYIQNFSLGVQYQLSSNWLAEVNYVASKGTRLFQRRDLNPFAGWDFSCLQPNVGQFFPLTPHQCRNARLDDTHGGITETTNGGSSSYSGMEARLTKRFGRTKDFGDFTMSMAYSWSHMLDNASEIFGPGLRFVSAANLKSNIIDILLDPLAAAPVEAITPFAQTYNQTSKVERANSSFDRRHRLAVSFLWEPFPASNMFLRGWQFNGVISVQSGQPYTPLNASPLSACADSNGDGRIGSDRPDIGNPKAPLNSVALIDLSTNPYCLPASLLPAGAFNYVDLNGNPINPATAHFIQRPLQPNAGAGGDAGRNILTGPGIANMDFSLYKVVKFKEHYQLQFRWEVYDLFNHANPGNPIGNAFGVDAQPAPGYAFGTTQTAAAISGIIPENAIDATDISGKRNFLSQKNMNASSRRMQFGIRFIF